MKHFIYKRLLVLSGMVILIALAASMAMAQITIQTTKTIDRDVEPVVVAGSQVADLVGAPVGQIFVYTYTGSGWGDQIPFQIDERDGGTAYLNPGDGDLDNNDEIVFMVKDLGDQAPDNQPLTATLTISDTWYEIEVTDPLSPTNKGWAYVVRSNALSPTFSDDYVVATSQSITTSQYVLGFATPSFFGINYLALGGSGVDILDRSKLQVVGTTISSFTLNEEDLSNPATVLVKDGPVRAILNQTATTLGVPQLTVYKAYGQVLQGTANVDLTIGASSISSVRTSIDLITPTGTVTFYNANTAATGVTVDGSPDSVSETPLSEWTQISHPDGRFIQVGDPSPAGGTAKSFYRDNNSQPDPLGETGESGSYGDAGFLVEGSINSVFSLESWLFFLPSDGGATDNVGARYGNYFSNALSVVARSKAGGAPVFLPIIIKNN